MCGKKFWNKFVNYNVLTNLLKSLQLASLEGVEIGVKVGQTYIKFNFYFWKCLINIKT